MINSNDILEVVAYKCPCCGGSLNGIQGMNLIKCQYCGTESQLINPARTFEQSIKSNLNPDDKQKFLNLAKIMEKSILANNYAEAYDYCNKLLEIDATVETIWINKAVCSFWLSTDNKILFTQAKEIVTYVNSAKEINANSEIVNSICEAIATNLFEMAHYYLYKIPKGNNQPLYCGGYKLESLTMALNYIKLMDTAFDIFPNPKYLRNAILQLTPWYDKAKMHWENIILHSGTNKYGNTFGIAGYPVLEMRDAYIKKIKTVQPDYQPIPQPKGLFTGGKIKQILKITGIVLGSIIFIFILVLIQINKKETRQKDNAKYDKIMAEKNAREKKIKENKTCEIVVQKHFGQMEVFYCYSKNRDYAEMESFSKLLVSGFDFANVFWFPNKKNVPNIDDFNSDKPLIGFIARCDGDKQGARFIPTYKQNVKISNNAPTQSKDEPNKVEETKHYDRDNTPTLDKIKH